MRIRTLFSVLAFAGLLVLAGCSGSGRLSHSSAQQAYDKGMEAYEDENYERAQRYFRGVFQYGRGNEWADDAQFFLASSYREQSKYLLAANEFERFTQLYRTSQRVAQAEFERANAYYNLSPQYELDQSDTRQAISYFQLFIERYPTHELVTEAQEKIRELRAKLAHKKHAAAALYERRDMWEAAAQTYEAVFNEYPETPWADDALLGAVRSYVAYANRSIASKQEERYRKAVDHYNRLAQLFPESALLRKAEDYYRDADAALQRIEGAEESDASLASEDASTR